jgi:hypothetical protein
MLRYGIVISFIIVLSSCHPLSEKDMRFARKNTIELQFLDSFHGPEDADGFAKDGFSARIYRYSGDELCKSYYSLPSGMYFDNGGLFKKFNFDIKRSCIILSNEKRSEGEFIISDKNTVLFYDYWN